MIALRGKRGRQVSVILTPDVKTALELLVSCRSKIIKDDNPYLFPRASGNKHIRGSDIVRQMAHKADLQYPERIGSTNMRKYIATVVQVISILPNSEKGISLHTVEQISQIH